MRRRDFLRAIAGGTVAALLGVQARQVETDWDAALERLEREVGDRFRQEYPHGGWPQRHTFGAGTLTLTSEDGERFTMPLGMGDMTYTANK